MRRRDFISLVGGVAVGWPLAARAQDRVRRIGVLVPAGRAFEARGVSLRFD